MSSLFGIINSIVPFADPSRPLWRDVLLSAFICSVLYVAPQIDFGRLRYTAIVNGQRAAEHRAVQPELDAHVARQNAPGHPADDVDGDINAVAGEDVVAAAGEDPAVLAAPEHQEARMHAAAQVDEAGPANPHQPRPRNENREVGAKKARAIARRNQQRAYNEFMREQGDAQRAEWARDEAERQKQIAADQERRRAIDDKVRDKERKEREERKANLEVERRAELGAVKAAAMMIEARFAEKNCISVAEVKKAVKRDDVWVHELVRREGFLGTKTKDGARRVTMLTKSGWLVRVDTAMMDEVYTQTEAACERGDGKVTWHEMGRSVQQSVVSGT